MRFFTSNGIETKCWGSECPMKPNTIIMDPDFEEADAFYCSGHVDRHQYRAIMSEHSDNDPLARLTTDDGWLLELKEIR